MEDSVIWQPRGVYSKGDFSITIDRGFVEKVSSLEINEKVKKNMKDLANRLMRTDGRLSQPFGFEGDTYMVSQFTTEAGNGVWLSIDSGGRNALEVFKGNIKLNSHNVDHSYQQADLMSLVDIWATYYDAVKDSLS